MVALMEKIDGRLKAALKALDDERLQAVRKLKSDLQYKRISGR